MTENDLFIAVLRNCSCTTQQAAQDALLQATVQIKRHKAKETPRSILKHSLRYLKIENRKHQAGFKAYYLVNRDKKDKLYTINAEIARNFQRALPIGISLLRLLTFYI